MSARAHNPGGCDPAWAAACRLPPLYSCSPGKFCPDDHYAPCQGTSIRRIGQAPPTTGDQAVPYIGALFNIGFHRVESGEGSPGVVHELAPAGEWTEDFLRASWPSRGLSRSPNRVADKRRLVVVAGIIITALLHCRICSRTGSTGVPRPPPQHPTSVPFIRKQPGFQPSPQTLTHHTRSLPLSSLLTPQISDL